MFKEFKISELIYKCINPEECKLSCDTKADTYVLRNSTHDKVFINTVCDRLYSNVYQRPFNDGNIDLSNEPIGLFCDYESYKDYFKVFIDMEDYKILDTLTFRNNNYDNSDIISIYIYNNSLYNGKIELVKNDAKYSLICALKSGFDNCSLDNYKNIEINFYKAVANRKFDNISVIFNVGYSEEELDKIVEIANKIIDLVGYYDSFEKTVKIKKYAIDTMLNNIVG